MLYSAGVLHRAEFFYKRSWHTDVLYGVVWFIAGRVLSLWLGKFFVLPSHGFGLFTQNLFSFIFPFWFIALGGLFFLNKFKGTGHLPEAYLAGYGAFSGLSMVISRTHPPDPYILFVLPLIIGVSLVYLAQLRSIFVSSVGRVFAGTVAGIAGIPFLFAFAAFLYYRNLPLLALPVSVILCVPGLILLYKNASAQLSKNSRP
ncbi:MAG: hypothetical protein JXB03_03495 [Spirochaetales bacterium]|nr:hypothetical protein [Spirochaetales bacterium]